MYTNPNEILYTEENSIISLSLNKYQPNTIQIAYTTCSDQATTHIHVLQQSGTTTTLIPLEMKTTRKHFPMTDVQFLPNWFTKPSFICASDTLEIYSLNEKSSDLLPVIIDGFSLQIPSDFPIIGIESFTHENPLILTWQLNGELSLWSIGEKSSILFTKQSDFITDVCTSRIDENIFCYSSEKGIVLCDKRTTTEKIISERKMCQISFSNENGNEICVGGENVLHILDLRNEQTKMIEYKTKGEINDVCWENKYITLGTSDGIVLWNPLTPNNSLEYSTESSVISVDCCLNENDWCCGATENVIYLLHI